MEALDAQRYRPEQYDNSHVAFVLTHGFAARTVLRSGVAGGLVRQGGQITLITPNAEETYFREECEREQVSLIQEPGSAGRVADWFRAYRPYLLDNVMNNVALKTKHVLRSEKYPFRCSAMALINRTVAQRPFFRRCSKRLEIRLNRSKKVHALLSKLDPQLLILSTPFGTEDTLYLLHARDLGITTVCQVLSWDNITSKGTPLLMPDYFISWGPIMTDEIVNLYYFPRNKIYECGVPHFDVYHQQGQFKRSDVIAKNFGLPTDRPYIFYGMVAPYSCPNELDILGWLVERINNIAFNKPCSLIIRPHPQTISGIYARDCDDLDRLKSLAGPNVALDIPPVLSERLAWDLPKSDMHHLAGLIARSAMCLNANSTLCLDACVLDKPVINIAFDGWNTLPYEKSARRGINYVHMAKLLALGGIRIARSFDDLEQHINAYLADPQLDHEGRMRSATQECGLQDGHAADRVVHALSELLQISGQKGEHLPPIWQCQRKD
jgi:hypothetical protein